MAAPLSDKALLSLASLARMGCSAVETTVSQYSSDPGNRGPDGSFTPLKWQSIAKHVNASKPWAVAVRDDPDTADLDARKLFAEMHGSVTKQQALAKQKKLFQPVVVDFDYDDGDDLI